MSTKKEQDNWGKAGVIAIVMMCIDGSFWVSGNHSNWILNGFMVAIGIIALLTLFTAIRIINEPEPPENI